MFTLCARVVIRIKHSLQVVSNEDCHQFMASMILPVFATVFTGFFHCPGKNSFCHGKNPTLDVCGQDDVTEHGFCTTHWEPRIRFRTSLNFWSELPMPGVGLPWWCSSGFTFVDDGMFVRYWSLRGSASTSGTSTESDSPLDSTDLAPQRMLI